MTRIDDKNDDVFVELIDFGSDVTAKEAVTMNEDGSYTIFVNSRISINHQAEAVQHALRHIHNNDFQKTDVQQIESEAHGMQKDSPDPEFEKMIKRHRRASARRKKKIAEYEKFIEMRMEVDDEYRREHTLF